MSVIVIVKINAKENSLEELKNYFKKILPDTRAYKGCQGVQLYQSKETPTKFTIHAKWVSEEVQKKYMAWRIETGELDNLTQMISEPPSIQFYNIVDE